MSNVDLRDAVDIDQIYQVGKLICSTSIAMRTREPVWTALRIPGKLYHKFCAISVGLF